MQAHIPHQGAVTLPEADPFKATAIDFALELNSTAVPKIVLGNQHGNALTITRDLTKPYDTVLIEDPWVNGVSGEAARAKVYIRMVAIAREELKANDLEAHFNSHGDDAWNRYRDAQMAVMNSLQQATEALIVKAATKNAELDTQRSERFRKLEEELRKAISEERQKLHSEFDSKLQTLTDRERMLTERESNFNTKESKYVARQKQDEQIQQVENWLNDWKLTAGTTEKRFPVLVSYVVGLVVTGLLSIFATYHNFELMRSADDVAKLQWWHWAAITAKSFFPLAAFVTFMVYLIRWTSAWARQHSDEEFMNRSRLIDIGRASWLLEAVRDAHETNKDIPADLLKELSRNLFSHTPNGNGEIDPQSAAEVLLQGFSSLRVKSPDGSEVEAKRGK